MLCALDEIHETMPKVHKPVAPPDFRPISVTPILSRLVERYIYPAFLETPMHSQLADQYAFRPTGSTTAALIAIQHHIAYLLRTNEYVSLVSIDFSKAFDMVWHSTLASKLSTLNLPDNIYNWMIDFLKDRHHATRFLGVLSTIAAINASNVQGSGLGPPTFNVNGSNLHPQYHDNIMVKYADDTYLLVGSSRIATIGEEMEAIERWASACHLSLNRSKTHEMVITLRPRISTPPLIDGIKRVKSKKILGVVMRDDLRADDHVNAVLASCRGSIHALWILKSRGLSIASLQQVAAATTVSRMLYAAPHGGEEPQQPITTGWIDLFSEGKGLAI